jgi:hypothetical protein
LIIGCKIIRGAAFTLILLFTTCIYFDVPWCILESGKFHAFDVSTSAFINAEGKIKQVIQSRMSQDSAVGIATGYGLDDGEVGVRVPVG